MSDDTKFRFLIVTIGLLIALVLGYIKFIPHQKNNQGISEKQPALKL
ncbi:MAG: hypothetical protein PHP25_04160 [Candidatus Moranbacteria bacterium]|nr:hypothetical protein [Candidatus Moranbacteria bacterium]